LLVARALARWKGFPKAMLSTANIVHYTLLNMIG
jgi:hypothetical protein